MCIRDRIDLFYDKCPLAAKNFIKLCKIKYYNNALFLDVQKDYLSRVSHLSKPQTSIYEVLYGSQAKYFEDEFDPELKHNKMGIVSTANLGPNKNSSDFFITLANRNLDHLNNKHTVFGQVAEGLEALQKINDAYVDEKYRPYLNIRIHHTLILEDPFDDPPGLDVPDLSPDLIQGDDRIEFQEKDKLLDEKGRTEEEIIEATKEHEAKTKAIVLEMLNDLPDADIKPPDNVLFVCKLNPVTQERDLELIFSRFGSIRSCEIIRDWKTGASLQYAFIEFETAAACEEAYFKMDNALIDERRIHVDFSQSVAKLWAKFRFKPRGGGGGVGGGDKGGDNGDGPRDRVQLKVRPRRDEGKYEILFDEEKRERRTKGNKERPPQAAPVRDEPKDDDKKRDDQKLERAEGKRDDRREDRSVRERVTLKEKSTSRGREKKDRERSASRNRDRKDKDRGQIRPRSRDREREREKRLDRYPDKRKIDDEDNRKKDAGRRKSRSPRRSRSRSRSNRKREEDRKGGRKEMRDSYKREKSREKERKRRRSSSSESSSSSDSSSTSRSSSQ
eukprot:TRINITY_DN3261_c0_g1_i3.p1 TRINITY_DN3261_c0_g1~~TRINITY_DN3261_c0_g1_i3.p1  ORF type:complete len:559 (-),score=112.96 TRINITY_DN3261_c0_g1_i3:238-1914(-)